MQGTYRTQDGFVKESIEHECEKRRDSSVLTGTSDASCAIMIVIAHAYL